MIDLIGKILCSSINNLFQLQPDIFDFTDQTGETEWNLCHHLANEVCKYIFWLNHDIDLTKRYFNGKRPDMIFHKRGSYQLNFLAIELKHRGADTSEDISRVRQYWMSRQLNYRFGASIKITDKSNYEVTVLSRDDQQRLNQTASYIPLIEMSESEKYTFVEITENICTANNPDIIIKLSQNLDQMVCNLYACH